MKSCRFCDLLRQAYKQSTDDKKLICEGAMVVNHYYFGRYAGRDLYPGMELNFCPVCGLQLKTEVE